MEDFLYGIAQGLGVILIFPNHVTIVFSFRTFHEAVEMVHYSSIPTTIYGRVVPSPLPFDLRLFAAKISLFMNPLLTYCGVLRSCIGECLSSKFLRV